MVCHRQNDGLQRILRPSNPGNLGICYVAWQKGSYRCVKDTDGGGYPGSSRWAQTNHRSPSKQRTSPRWAQRAAAAEPSQRDEA